MLHKDKEKKKAYDKEYNQRPKVKARKKAYSKEYTQRPGVMAKKAAASYKWIAKPKNKAKHRMYVREYNRRPNIRVERKWYNIKKKYNLTQDQFKWILLAQGGKCLVCSRELGDNINVDHCHETGAIRGLLHNNCNWMLGNADDNPELLKMGANYLEAQI